MCAGANKVMTIFASRQNQVVLEGTRDVVEQGVRCLPAQDFLAALV